MTTTVKPVAKKSSSAKKQAKNITAEIVKQVSTYQDEIALDLIDVSAQPRKIFDQNDLKELADSIKAKGLLQNVLLRRRGERYELLVGERRLRAHKIVNLPTIRATIGEFDDNEVFEIKIHENLHRRDLTALEEAESYDHLLQTVKIGGLSIDIKELALRVKKTQRYVLKKLKLAYMIDEAKEDLHAEVLPLSLAYRLAALPIEAQPKAYPYCFEQRWQGGKYSPDKEYPVRESDFLDEIESNIFLNLEFAPFPLDAEDLHPEKGACLNCSDRTGGNLLFEEMAENDCCLNEPCYNLKSDNFVQIKSLNLAKRRAVVEVAPEVSAIAAPDVVSDAPTHEKQTAKSEEAEKVQKTDAAPIKPTVKEKLQEIKKVTEFAPEAIPDTAEICARAAEIKSGIKLISTRWSAENPAYLSGEKYRAINSEAQVCAFAEIAIIAEGNNIGTEQLICAHADCQKHRGTSNSSGSSSSGSTQTPEERKERKQELFNIRTAEIARKLVLADATRNIDTDIWQNPHYQRLICSTIIGLMGNYSLQKRFAFAEDIVKLGKKELSLDKKTFKEDIDALALAEKLESKDEQSIAKIVFALITASFGENFYESKVPQDAVQFIAERENVNYLAKDAEARIQLTRERPDYKRFLLLAEQFQREVGEADQTQLKEMKTPVFFD